MIALAPGLCIGPLTLRHHLPHSGVWVCEVAGLDHVIRVSGDRLRELAMRTHA